MDVSKWPIERIMQLPDEAFGRRWLVGVGSQILDASSFFDISEAALPERFVIWGVNGMVSGGQTDDVDFTLALGLKLPTSDAEFDSLELLFGGIVGYTDIRGSLMMVVNGGGNFGVMRLPVISGGRRLVGRVKRNFRLAIGAVMNIVISSIPKEVPDFYAGFPEDKFDEMIRLMRIGVKFR